MTIYPYDKIASIIELASILRDQDVPVDLILRGLEEPGVRAIMRYVYEHPTMSREELHRAIKHLRG